MNKWELVKIGKSLARLYESEAALFDFKDDERHYNLYDAEQIKKKVKEIEQLYHLIEVDERLDKSDPFYSTEYPYSDSLSVRKDWFFRQSEHLENCSFCGLLPDELTVLTGQGERFPEMFYKLTRFGDDYPAAFGDSDFRRCPQCGICFLWIDQPEMYGTGNNDKERIERFSQKESELLDKILLPENENNTELLDTEEFFEHLTLTALLKTLNLRVSDAPQIVAVFVPKLVHFLVKHSNNTVVKQLLLDYVSNKPERAKEILNALRSMDKFDISQLTSLILDCALLTERQN